MLAVDKVGSHIIITVASDCVLCAGAAENTNDGGLLSSRSFLKLLALQLTMLEGLGAITATDLFRLNTI